MSDKPKKVVSSDYTEEYFLTCCQGFSEFGSTTGNILPLRLRIPWEIADIKPNDLILDLGCGRGELVKQATLQGNNIIGIDYSPAALKLSKQLLNKLEVNKRNGNFSLICGNAFDLPIKDEAFDFVIMLDVIEHLYEEETNKSLRNIRNILKPNGKLIIHTMPNLNYYRWGYPIFRLVEKVRGNTLPKNPRDRWKDYSHVHVNEQTPRKLSKFLSKNGFKSNVFLYNLNDFENEKNIFFKKIMSILVNYVPFKWIFCNDIIAIAVKK
jgi:SAM-dependent methyltransferase